MSRSAQHFYAGVKGDHLGLPVEQLSGNDSGSCTSVAHHLVGQISCVCLEDVVDPFGIRRASCVVFGSCARSRHLILGTTSGPGCWRT